VFVGSNAERKGRREPQGMSEELNIILYPDPRLKRVSKKIAHFDEKLGDLVKRMFELMREAKGVGLAAPQVGQNIRLFISNHSGKPEDDRVYVNPELTDAEGTEAGEEGCLSLPGLHVQVDRAKTVHLKAQDLTGKVFEQTETGYLPRIWQHELDHLNGTMLIDRMGITAQMENRKLLKDLEDKYLATAPLPPKPKPKPKPKRTAKTSPARSSPAK
jgi:peptide deformylase